MQVKQKQDRISEREYRSLKTHVNYSMIKVFYEDRQRFVKEFILGEQIDRKESLSLVMGSLIDCLVTDRDRFDDKFCIVACTEPKGQMKDLADNLFRRTVMCLEDGKVTLELSALLEQAIQDTKYDYTGTEVAFKGKTFDKIVEMFSGSDAELYYNEKRKNFGKTAVTVHNVEKAELIVNELRSNPFTTKYTVIEGEDIEVHDQLPILFKYKELECKALVDRLIVDHKNQTVQPIDLKSSYDPDGFGYSYLKHGYWIQAAHYDMAVSHWMEDMHYQLLPMKFLVCDSTGVMASCVYELTEIDKQYAYDGFKLKSGRSYPGLITLLNDISWGIETGRWNVSRQVYENSGVVPLDIEYS